MAFTHGKNAQFALRDITNTWQDMTPYTSEVTFPGKAGIAETTVFGKGAKTYIGGLLEGQLTMKGFWDPTATIGPDAVLAGLLGTQPTVGMTVVAQVLTQSSLGQAILFPAGSSTGVALIADVVLTDYSITAPVNNVVSYTATFNLSGATPGASVPHNGSYAGGAGYGLQIVRGAVADVLSADWIAAGSGPTSYSTLISSTA